MPDRFSDQSCALDSPATHAFSITPNDASDLVEVTRAIHIGGAGAIRARLLSGADVTFSGLAGGSILTIRATRILATGTTATSLVGMV